MKNIFLIFLFGVFVACQQNPTKSHENRTPEMQSATMTPKLGESSKTAIAQEDVWLESLITDTPQEGRELAIKMARKTIGAIQKDPEVKKRLRAEYAENPQHLILSAQVVATEFKTVAEANNYWRN